MPATIPVTNLVRADLILGLRSLVSPRPMALLILLPAAARARIVASHLLPHGHGSRPAGIVAAQLQRRQFLILLALDVAREVFHLRLGRAPPFFVRGFRRPAARSRRPAVARSVCFF